MESLSLCSDFSKTRVEIRTKAMEILGSHKTYPQFLEPTPNSPLPKGEGPGVRAEPRRRPGWRFWLLWVLASAVGWAVGWAVVSAVFGTIVDWAVGWAVGRAMRGAVVGAAQWLVLRRQVRRAGWWILASTVGWTVGRAMGLVVFGASFGVVEETVFGAVVGAAQWLVLHLSLIHI